MDLDPAPRGRPGSAPNNIDFITDDDFTSDVLAEYANWSLEVHGPPPENPPLKRLLAKGKRFTRAR